MAGPKNFYSNVDCKKLGIDALASRVTENESDIAALQSAVGQLLPSVTEADDGKVLEVISGQWDKSELDITTIAKNVTNIQKTLDNLLNPPVTLLHKWILANDSNSLVDTVDGNSTLIAKNVTYDSESVILNSINANVVFDHIVRQVGNVIKVEFGDVDSNFNINTSRAIMSLCFGFGNANEYAGCHGIGWNGSSQRFGVFRGGAYNSLIFERDIDSNIVNPLKNGSIELKLISNSQAEIYFNGQYAGDLPLADNNNKLCVGWVENAFTKMCIKSISIFGI